MKNADLIYVTNTFTLHDPADADGLIDLVKAGIVSTSSKNPGYVSDTVLRAADGKSVVNLSVWSGGLEQLGANHAANEANPDYGRQMADVGALADIQPMAYTVAFRHEAPASEGDVTSADVQRWIDAWNSHDLDRITALFTDDVVMHQPQNPTPLDKAALGSFFDGLFKSYADIRFELQGHTIQGRDVASWERVTGTMTGEFHDPATGKAIAPTGKRFDILGAMHLTYGDAGLIREVRIYWDRLLMMKQVGLIGASA